MKQVKWIILASLLTAPMTAVMAEKNDYPTEMRVKYVLDCMTHNGDMNVYESTYKCSCVIDKLAENFTVREFDDGAVTIKLMNMPADRGATFRDNKDAQASVKTLKNAQAEAYDACHIKR